MAEPVVIKPIGEHTPEEWQRVVTAIEQGKQMRQVQSQVDSFSSKFTHENLIQKADGKFDMKRPDNSLIEVTEEVPILQGNILGDTQAVSQHNRILGQTLVVQVYKCELCCCYVLSEADLKKHHCVPTEQWQDVRERPISLAGSVKHDDHEGIESKNISKICFLSAGPTDEMEHQSSHTYDTQYVCKYCSKGFVGPFDLAGHLMTHINDKPFICQVCNKGFSQSFDFNRHLLQHSVEKSFTCKFCNERFVRPGDLTKHARTHCSEKPFTCQVCNKSFCRSSFFAKHLRTHSNEKPFICRICEQKFSTPSALIDHARIHSSEKPFTCHICNIGFSQSRTLDVHLRNHSSGKPFTCHICNKAFSEARNLNNHLRTHRS